MEWREACYMIIDKLLIKEKKSLLEISPSLQGYLCGVSFGDHEDHDEFCCYLHQPSNKMPFLFLQVLQYINKSKIRFKYKPLTNTDKIR